MRILVGVIWVALSGAAFITVDAAAAGKAVKASFKLKGKTYNDSLANPTSAYYINLKDDVVLTVLGLPIAIGCKVLSFRDASDLVIVDIVVSTNKQTWKPAHNQVYKGLRTKTSFLYKDSVQVGVRLCVPVKNGCDGFNTDTDTQGLRIICIPARDRVDCLKKLNNKEVDLARGDAADVYLAHVRYNGDLSVVAETRDEDKKEDIYRYRAVAVVRRSSFPSGLDNLTGSRSCNTGYGKTSGWHVPISKLVADNKMSLNCSGNVTEVEKILRSVSSYFSQACIPGKWAPDEETNKRLKAKYSNLCSLCDDPLACSSSDSYAGYDGALECLTKNRGPDKNADVAWTKLDAVHKFFIDGSNNVTKEHFGLLLYNGTIVDIDSQGSNVGTWPAWAARPWPVWFTWLGHSKQGYGLVRTLEKVMKAASDNECTESSIKPWAEDVLGITKCSIIEKLKRRTPENYLKEADYYTTISFKGCNAPNVRLCVDSQTAEEKCLQLSDVLESHRVRPHITCVLRDSEANCVDAIIKGMADIVTLDGGDVFKAYSDNPSIIPVISEVYGEAGTMYYAVAVVKENSNITSLDDLRDKKSCHTAIGKSAGWIVPVKTLLEEVDDLNENNCNYTEQIGNFFGQSCAPGSKSTKYDPKNTNPKSLCSLCVGDGDPGQDHKCERDSDERYYGYSGAFRCLVEQGDVAFVKHTTVDANTGLTSDDVEEDSWNFDLQANDYRLLCKDGSKQEVSEYESCYWAIVPSHKVVTRNDAIQEEIRSLLLRASETLSKKPDVFAIFGDYDGARDIIFKSSATSLENLSEGDFLKLLNGTIITKLDDKCA